MRRFIFMCAIALISGIFLAILLTSRDVVWVADPLTEIEKSLMGSGSRSLSLSGEIVSSKDDSSREILILDSLDSIVLSQDASTPVIEPGKIQTIKLQEGLYLFSLGNIFTQSIIQTNSLSIEPLATGIFFIDVRPSVTRVYSATAPLKITLTQAWKPLTDIRLFPSGLLVHSAEFNEELRNADIFRVAQIDSVQNLDIRSPEEIKIIFGPRTAEAGKLFSSIQEYLKKRDTRFREFYKNFTVQDGSSREEIEKYSTFLVNDTKKKVLLRNSLIQDLQSILQSSNSACDTVCTKKRAEHMNDIQNILRTAESLDTSTAEDFREIIKRYVFLGLTHTDTRPTSYFVEGRSPIGDLASTILPAGSDLMSRYRILSEIFNEYLIAQGDEKKLDENMQNFIRVLVTGKTIENTELLPLIFYIKEYLTLRNEDINISSLGMASSMITLADRHLDAQKDTSKKFDSLSIFLYTFVSLFDQSHENIVTRFFEWPTERQLLKKEYQGENGAEIDGVFLSQYESLISTLSGFLKRHSTIYAQGLNVSSADTINLSDQLSRTLEKHTTTLAIFKDYTTYVNNLNLSDESKNIQAIIVKNTESPESIKAYVNTFSEINTERTRITNTPETDGYFLVETEIRGLPFRFRIRGVEKYLENIEYLDASGTSQIFRGGVSLVEREKLVKEQVGWLTSPLEREQASFRNYFVRTYFENTPIEKDPIRSPAPGTPVRSMTPDMLVFVQRDLLEWDFKSIQDLITVPIQSVFAEIVDGKYDISLSNIEFRTRSKDMSYLVNCSGKYQYTLSVRAFSNMSCRVYEEDRSRGFRFGGASFPILPNDIALGEFSQKMGILWKYIDQIRLNSNENYTGIFIDFTTDSVMIQGNIFPLSP